MAALIGVLWLTLAFPAAGIAAPAQTVPPEKTELELEKLREEVRKLRLENDNADSVGAVLLRWGPFATVVAGVLAILFNIRKEVREQRALRQKELEHRVEQARLEQEQRDKELQQRKVEAQRRFDEQFATAVQNLGSNKESVQLSAVVVLDSLLRHDGAEFGDQVYWVVCANLPLHHPVLVNRFLVRTFAKAVRLRLANESEEAREPLDLANCIMPRVDLKGLSLQRVDIAFASLRDAQLVETDLSRARGYQVNLERAWLTDATLTEARLHGATCRQAKFHRANLVSAEFKMAKADPADLSYAEFFGARMQGSHFERANLTGAAFAKANVADAYFADATFDDAALWSMLETEVVGETPSWRKAHFDEGVAARLESMSTRRRPRRGERRRTPVAPADPAVEPARETG